MLNEFFNGYAGIDFRKNLLNILELIRMLSNKLKMELRIGIPFYLHFRNTIAIVIS